MVYSLKHGKNREDHGAGSVIFAVFTMLETIDHHGAGSGDHIQDFRSVRWGTAERRSLPQERKRAMAPCAHAGRGAADGNGRYQCPRDG